MKHSLLLQQQQQRQQQQQVCFVLGVVFTRPPAARSEVGGDGALEGRLEKKEKTYPVTLVSNFDPTTL